MKRASATRLIIFAILAVFLLGLRVVPLPTSAQANHGNYVTTMTTQSSSSVTSGDSLAPHSGYGMDCNGYSPIYSNAPYHTICSDPKAVQGTSSWDGRFYDNGHYIGHDEPDVQFYSSAPESGYNLQWAITLPKDPALPPTQNGSVTIQAELGIFWLGLSLCDPWSYPYNPCTPDSDTNVGGGTTYPYGPPDAAGAAHLELQFYPPYLHNDCQRSWCVAMDIDSFESGNSNCGEPGNVAYIQVNGVPTGPPGPGNQTSATFTANSETLFLNSGDRVLVTIKDTTAGMYVGIEDLTTGRTGYMFASAANGFLHTNVKDCSTQPFSFHPEFATAKQGNVNPWSSGGDYVSLAFEIGHFELGIKGDSDTDEAYCGVLEGVDYCAGDGGGASNADRDFDSISYNASGYYDRSKAHPAPIVIGNPGDSGVGPASWDGKGYTAPYGTIRFTTIIGNSIPGCSFATGAGCTLPPVPGTFYPYFYLSGSGSQCAMNFGNSVPGFTANDLGGDAEYGSSDPNYHITIQGPFVPNPCASDLQRLAINYSIPNDNALPGNSLPKPSLSYLTGGQTHNTTLSSASTVVFADPDSRWNLSESQQGLPQGVRVEGLGPASGNLSEATNITLAYYLQAHVQFAYKIEFGGSGYASPSVQYVSLGRANQTSPAIVWTDLGSKYAYDMQLGGSTSSERWEVNQSQITGIVVGSETVAPWYYHQYLVSLSASPPGFGVVSPSQSQWYDAGAAYPISAKAESGYSFKDWSSSSSLLVLGDASSSSTTVTINGPGTVQANFQGVVAVSSSIISSSSLTTVSSATKSPGGGIPEFPLQFVAIGIFVVLLAGAYLAVRYRLATRQSEA